MTTESVLQHHLQCFGAGDLNGIISDYTEKSVLFTPNGALRGTRAIRDLFVGMFAEFAKPGASFEMVRQDVDGEIAYIVWKARTADNDYELGTDTFVVRGGCALTCRSASGSTTMEWTVLLHQRLLGIVPTARVRTGLMRAG